jgi:hypothetical protein
MKLCTENSLNFSPTIQFSTMTMLQLIRCSQAISDWKGDYWNEKPILLPWFGSKWLAAVCKNKVCLKVMKISGYWTLKKVTMTLKAIPQQELQKCFQQWQHRLAKCTAAEGEWLQRWPLSVSYKYAGMLAIKSLWELHSHTSYMTLNTNSYKFYLKHFSGWWILNNTQEEIWLCRINFKTMFGTVKTWIQIHH